MTDVIPPGPVSAGSDLRTMLRRHLVRRATASLGDGAQRRSGALSDEGALKTWISSIRRNVRDLIKPDPVQQPMRTTLVSRRESSHHVLENVLFESIDGWQVNASVFVPRDPMYQPPYPAIVVPCGHDSKSSPGHQLPPQVFARAGFVAITFDSPGHGEKAAGNAPFPDGLRGEAVGLSALRYFLADALRAMDYLATREDVDAARGFAMTGISSAGHIAVWAALLDERVRLIAPVCCAAGLIEQPLGNGHLSGPELLPVGRLSYGLDDADLMAAIAPLPQLCMAGTRDELFTPAAVQRVVEEVRKVYAGVAAADHLEFFLDDTGHDYSVNMARRFVAFADRHWLGQADREHARCFGDEPVPEHGDAMRCRPAGEPNMFTFALARAESLRTTRGRLMGRADAARAVRSLVPGIEHASIEHTQHGPSQRVWNMNVQELLLRHEQDIELPAVALRPVDQTARAAAIVMFDDRGRWASLRQYGWLAAAARFREPQGPCAAVLSVDLRGWGDTRPADTAFDLARDSGTELWTSCLANSLSDGLLAQRTRDALACIRWFTQQPGIDPQRLVLVGHGVGGLVALLAASLTKHFAGIVTLDSPMSLEDALATPDTPWPVSIFLPDVLSKLDVQPLADALGQVLTIRPRDGKAAALRDDWDGKAVTWIQQRLNLSQG